MIIVGWMVGTVVFLQVRFEGVPVRSNHAVARSQRSKASHQLKKTYEFVGSGSMVVGIPKVTCGTVAVHRTSAPRRMERTHISKRDAEAGSPRLED